MRYAALIVPLVALLALACGEAEVEPTATPTPAATQSPKAQSPTPRASPSVGGAQGFGSYDDPYDFRSFTAQLDAAVRSADIQFFLDNTVFQDLSCAGEFLVPPACADQPSATSMSGIIVGVWKSEGFAYGHAEYEAFIREFLTGGGEPKLWAWAKFGQGFDSSKPFETVHVIATSIVPPSPPTCRIPDDRCVALFAVSFDGLRWKIDHLEVGDIEFLDPVGLAQPDDPYAVVNYIEFWQPWPPQP